MLRELDVGLDAIGGAENSTFSVTEDEAESELLLTTILELFSGEN